MERTLYKKPEALGFRPRVFPMTLASHLLDLNLFFGNDLSAGLLISNTQGGFEQDSICKMPGTRRCSTNVNFPLLSDITWLQCGQFLKNKDLQVCGHNRQSSCVLQSAWMSNGILET